MNFLNCGVNELTNITEDESFYGHWPCCEEIDIMEVVGSDTSKAFGTVHYGSPHAESQGSILLGDNAFSDEFHLFSCEWKPGKLTKNTNMNFLWNQEIRRLC